MNSKTIAKNNKFELHDFENYLSNLPEEYWSLTATGFGGLYDVKDQYVAEIVEAYKKYVKYNEELAQRRMAGIKDVALFTNNIIDGYIIEEQCGMVCSTSSTKNLSGLLSSLIEPEYAKREAAQTRVLNDLKGLAYDRGGNAVINISFATELWHSSIGGDTKALYELITATGDAVKLRKKGV